MRGVRLPVVGLTMALALQWWSAPSGAADLMTAGWWWRAQTGATTLPPPPHVPPNGLAVGNAPDGPSAVAAVRFALQADERDPILTLAVADVFAAGDPVLVACPAGAPWFGPQAGPWEERPEAACAVGTVNGVESEDGASWTFALSAIYRDGLLDVVILPAEGSDPFEMSFEAPTAESLRTTKAPASNDFDSGFGSAGPGGETSFVPPSGFGGTDFGRPFSPLAPPAPPPGQAAPSEQPGPDGPRRLVPIARGPAPATTNDRSDPRPLALVILLAGLAVAVSLGRESLPSPRLLGPMADRRGPDPEEAEVRGLGRFRGPRQGEPPSLH